MATCFRTVKISFATIAELERKINNLRAVEVLEVKPCLPNGTDLNNWVEVYYGYSC